MGRKGCYSYCPGDFQVMNFQIYIYHLLRCVNSDSRGCVLCEWWMELSGGLCLSTFLNFKPLSSGLFL